MGKYLQGAAPNAANAFLSSAILAAAINGETAETPEVVQRIVLAYPVEFEGEVGEGEETPVGVQDFVPQDIVWSVAMQVDGNPIGASSPLPSEIRFRTNLGSKDLFPVTYDTPLPMAPVIGMSSSQSGEQDMSIVSGDFPLAYFGYINTGGYRNQSNVECLLRNETDADVIVQLHNWVFGFSNPVVIGEITVPAGGSAFAKWPVARGDHQVVATSYGTTGSLRYSAYLS